MLTVMMVDDQGQDGLVMQAQRGIAYGVTQASTAANALAQKAINQSTIANNLNGTAMGATPAVNLNPMHL